MMSSKHTKATLVLEDGSTFSGFSFGSETSISGEIVFNTGMVGYPESLTDPSYAGQLLVLTFPIIGNYGIPPVQERDEFGLPKFFESDTIHIRALIVSDYSHNHSHWNVGLSLSDWLKQQNVPALYGIDTRLLTKKIRAKGTMLAKILFGNDDLEFNNPNQVNLVSQVSCKQPRVFTSKANGPNPSLRILAVDCGMKNNIIRQLAALPDVQVKVVPWDHEFSKEQEYDGLFISNGPGDPTMCWKTVQQLQLVLEHSDKPVFGICLGNQLMSLAVGAKTYKMKFGNRGMNQPCIDARTNKCYITPQNHGFAVDTSSLPAEWKPFFYNANDGSNEGIYHTQKPFFSVQFHPEAKGGPTDTAFLFDLFLSKVKEYKLHGKTGSVTLDESALPKQKNTRENVKKVLILGSGGLSIGQAGEFDYSGSQCIKALKEHNIKTVLINPNIATCQTSQGLADKVYFVPITPQFVKEVCAKEKPDGVLLTFGGQTALNCGIQLYHEKFWEKSNIRVLGTPIETIIATEDREIFARKLEEIGVKIAPSLPARSIDEALEAATKIGYPIIVRAAYALGGLGSGFAHNETELRELVSVAFSHTEQVLVEKSLKGWKEIEYEVVRDCNDNCITVCNMENFDPLGIHTGDSIVIAPSLTLSNEEFYKLRSISIKTIRHLGVVGECNIQFGLDPHSEDYFVIEVNARLSRSSALASKATGYPLAFVAAKLSLGIPLTEIKNSITRTTTACFEPSLDYIVVKFPRWDLQKFDFVSRKIGSAMKSVGEVMSIGRTFEEVIQKAIRMVAPELDGFCEKKFDDLDHELESPSEQRIFAIALALKNGYTVDQIHDKSKIDKWFLYRLQNIVNLQREISQFDEYTIPTDKLLLAKQWGFSDRQIATCLKSEELEIRKLRKKHNILPYVKQIDTTAAEYPAQTNYLYMTYNGSEHDVKFNDYGIMVLGSGAYRIGSSVEFDWCAVSCVRTLRSLGFKSIMLNFNPETVSTDYDECDKLYFEELSFERVIDIYEAESSSGVILSVGGQTPNNLAMPLSKYGVKIHGTAAEEIDKAENRFKFSQLLDSIHVDQPSWRELTNTEEALEFAENVSYPVLVRPSYVLSGAAMNVAHNSRDLTRYLTAASDVSKEHPVVISKFIEEAKEVEMDAIACNGEVVLYAISEHVENAGVHSGDATLVLPAQNLYVETMRRVKGITKKIAKSLNITGPFNIQYLAKENDIKVIECNLRASRTFPFISKVFNINFIEMATKLMVGVPVKPIQKSYLDLDYVGVKAPMFSFTRLHGADPILGVEMASTGEVACFSENKADAFLISLVATGFKIPRPVGRKPSILLMLGTLEEKASFLNSARKLVELGFEIYTSSKTGSFLLDNGVPNTTLSWPYEEPESPRPGQPTGVPNTDASSMITYLEQKRIDIVINIPNNTTRELSNGYHVRRAAADLSVSLITNLKCAKLLVEALERVQKKRNRNQPEFEVKSWDEYMKENHL